VVIAVAVAFGKGAKLTADRPQALDDTQSAAGGDTS
jgi:hypothetical protein